MRRRLARAAALAQVLQLPLQRAQLADALRDMADVRVQQRVDVAALRAGGVLHAQQRAYLVQRHVQPAVMADELQPLQLRRVVDLSADAKPPSQLGLPFRPKHRRAQDKKPLHVETTAQLGPNQAGLDGLPESHFVGQNRAAGERRAKREQRRVHLMRVEVDRGVTERLGQLVRLIGAHPLRQLMREILGVIGSERRRIAGRDHGRKASDRQIGVGRRSGQCLSHQRILSEKPGRSCLPRAVEGRFNILPGS